MPKQLLREKILTLGVRYTNLNPEWFVRYEPNFTGNKKVILYNKKNGRIYLLNELYYIFLCTFPSTVKFKYLTYEFYSSISSGEIDDIYTKMLTNLVKLGVVHLD